MAGTEGAESSNGSSPDRVEELERRVDDLERDFIAFAKSVSNALEVLKGVAEGHAAKLSQVVGKLPPPRG